MKPQKQQSPNPKNVQPKTNQTQAQTQQPKKPKPKPQNPSEAKPSKAETEESQQKLLLKNVADAEAKIKQHEVEKRAAGKGIEQTFTFVRDSLNQLDKVQDLSKDWLKKSNVVDFLPFLPQNNQLTNLSVNNEEVLQQMNLDVSNLLKLPFNIFWSHVIFEPSILKYIDSFLRFKSRPFDDKIDLSDDSHVAKLYRNLCRRTFSLLVRLSSNSEGSLFISENYWGNLILEKQIWDVAKIFDVVLLFGNSNRSLVVEMVERLFKMSPKLTNQLQDSSKQIFDSLSQISSLLTKEYAKGEDSNPSPNAPEYIEYLIDILASLSSLQSLYPRATHSFQPRQDKDSGENSMLSILSNLYEDLLPLVRAFATGHQMVILEKSIVSISQSILDHCYFTVPNNQTYKLSACKVCASSDPEMVVDELLLVLTSIHAASDARKPLPLRKKFAFLKDVSTQYKLQYRLEILKRISHAKIDNVKFKYVMDFLTEICGPLDSKLPMPSKQQNQNQNQSQQTQTQTQTAQTKSQQQTIPPQIEQVKALFPDLGDGFIQACLKFLDNNPERVINALLEDRLPPDVEKMDRKLPFQSASTTKQTATQPKIELPTMKVEEVLNVRANVFDGDEFDIMSQKTLDASKIYRKDNSNKNMAVSLSLDKGTASKLKQTYLQYQYDDEYDDSFDENIKYGITSSDTDDDLRSSIEIPVPEEQENEEENSKQEFVPRQHGGRGQNPRGQNSQQQNSSGPKIMEPSRVSLSKREREAQQARSENRQIQIQQQEQNEHSRDHRNLQGQNAKQNNSSNSSSLHPPQIQPPQINPNAKPGIGRGNSKPSNTNTSTNNSSAKSQNQKDRSLKKRGGSFQQQQ